MLDLDLGKKTFTKIDLTRQVNVPIVGVTLSNSGFILCLTGSAVWSYDPARVKCQKVCDAPDGVAFQEIAYDPLTGDLLLTGMRHAPDGEMGEPEIYSLPKNESTLVHVSTRYGTVVGNPVFSADGALFFDFDGDLWTGYIEKNDDNGDGPARTLDAYRCAPLAALMEENTSPASTGLDDIAVTRHWIYARYARMGGSGWGSTIRFRRPVTEAQQLPNPEGMDWKELQRICDSVEQVGNDSRPCAFICASRDGSLVLYMNPYAGSDDVNLVRDEKTAETLTFKGLSKLFN